MNQFVSRYCRVAAASIPLLCGACAEESGPDEQLRQWLVDGEAAAESKDRGKLVDMISPSYADARGYKRQQINHLIRAYFLRQKTVKLLTSVEDIRLFGETAAEIDLKVGMAGARDNVLGFSADAYRFELELERDGGQWLLISARWGPLGEKPR